MNTRAEIYKALFEGKKLTHGTFGLTRWIKLDPATNKLVDQDNREYDTTFKVPSEWSIKPDKRRFSLFRYTFTDYDGQTNVIYSEKTSFDNTTEGEDDSNHLTKAVKVGDFEMED